MAARRVHAKRLRRDPAQLAKALGIRVVWSKDVPFRVGSLPDLVILAWTPSSEKRTERVWEGISQVLLTREGVAWNETSAQKRAFELSKANAPALRKLVVQQRTAHEALRGANGSLHNANGGAS